MVERDPPEQRELDRLVGVEDRVGARVRLDYPATDEAELGGRVRPRADPPLRKRRRLVGERRDAVEREAVEPHLERLPGGGDRLGGSDGPGDGGAEVGQEGERLGLGVEHVGPRLDLDQPRLQPLDLCARSVALGLQLALVAAPLVGVELAVLVVATDAGEPRIGAGGLAAGCVERRPGLGEQPVARLRDRGAGRVYSDALPLAATGARADGLFPEALGCAHLLRPGGGVAGRFMGGLRC
jgi:hypothetical protein